MLMMGLNSSAPSLPVYQTATISAVRLAGTFTGGEGTLNQWVHCEFVVSFEAICPVITQQVCGELF